MQRRIQIRLLTIFTIALIGTVLHSTARAQATGSAATSPTTAVAGTDRCEDNLPAALQCLDKALDAFEKSQKALGFAMDENAARKRLDGLKDELLKAKDQYIADVLADNAFLRKQSNGTKSKLRKVFEQIEKIGILIVGVKIGQGILK